MLDHKMGSCIATLRKEKGWTQKQLAEKLQLSDKAISKWESNKGTPSIEFLPEIAMLFDVTTDYLLKGEEILDVLKNYKTQDVSEKEKEAVINDNIVNIKKLIELDNFDVYQELINKHPATKEEELEKKLLNKDYDAEMYNYIIKNCNYHYKKKVNAADKNDSKNKNWDDALFNFIKGNKLEVFSIINRINNSKSNCISENSINYEVLKSRGYTSISKGLEFGKKDIKFKEIMNNNDIRFFNAAIEKYPKLIDWALENIKPSRFNVIKLLLDSGAKLHKGHEEDDGWGYTNYIDEIDEIGTELLKKKINDALGVK
jgi:transcriptional regulator with XRE-family HTH domain